MQKMSVMALVLATSMWFTGGTSMAVSVPNVGFNFVVIPSSYSTNNPAAQQNVFSYMELRSSASISTDIGNDPKALNVPPMLRFVDIVSSSSAAFKMWDGTNSPSGAFANENGKRMGAAISWSSATPFLVSDIWFRFSSNDANNNALGYSGNLATNTADGTPLTFSTTLKGELWDAAGNVIATYHNGEIIADHPVNRVEALPRVTWLCADMSAITLDGNYFKNFMAPEFVLKVAVYTAGFGVTNTLSSRPIFGNVSSLPPGTNANMTIYGQRLLPFSYGLEWTPELSINGSIWSTISASGLPDGYSFASTPPNTGSHSHGFYRAFQVPPSVAPSFASQSATVAVGKAIKLTLLVSNGPE